MSNFNDQDKNVKALEEQKERLRIISAKMHGLTLPDSKEKKKKREKQKLFYSIFEMILGLIGITLVIYNAGWLVGLGIWLLFWSNNFNILRAVGEKVKLIEFWNKDNDKD